MQCTAKSKRTHEQCRDRAMKGRGVCYHHGGKTPIGPGSPHFQTGKFSKFLPSRMAADFDAAMGDPELVSLRKEIATVDARIIDLFKRVDLGEAGSIWGELHEAWGRLVHAKSRAQADSFQLAFDAVGHLVDKGFGDTAAWVEVCKHIDLRRKLVDSEQRRLTMAHESLNSDKAMMLMTMLVSVLQKHINPSTCYQPRVVLGAIAGEMQGMLLMRKRDEVYEQVAIDTNASD